MGRDTIQLENIVSTISQEYLLEFTSEYGIPKDLHPELPGLEDTIMDFPEGKVELEQSLLRGRREDIPHRRGLAHKRPKGWDAISWFLFRSGRSSVEYKPNGFVRPNPQSEPIQGMDDTTVMSGSSGTPSTIEKSPLDFDNHNPTLLTTKGVGPVLEKEVAAMGPPVNKRRRQRGTDEAEANAPPKVLRKDHATPHPVQSTRGGKSLAAMGLEVGSTFTPVSQETSAGAKIVSAPDPLSYARPPPHSEQDVAQSSK
ncbi:hypothetical protein Tco_1157441, partial [Tanacetum coccineum]